RSLRLLVAGSAATNTTPPSDLVLSSGRSPRVAPPDLRPTTPGHAGSRAGALAPARQPLAGTADRLPSIYTQTVCVPSSCLLQGKQRRSRRPRNQFVKKFLLQPTSAVVRVTVCVFAASVWERF